MTAWVKKGTQEEVGIITDFVDPAYVNPALLQELAASLGIAGLLH
jgi:hypothetical protein